MRVTRTDVGIKCNLGLLDEYGDGLDGLLAAACLCALYPCGHALGLGFCPLGFRGQCLGIAVDALWVQLLAGVQLPLAMRATCTAEGHSASYE